MHTKGTDLVGLAAKVAGLERRITYMETKAFGEPQPVRCLLTLSTLYVDAVLGIVDDSQASADLWNHAALSLDEDVLLTLSRHTKDPFSWKPILLVLDYLKVCGFQTDRAAKHVLDVAKSLLKAQGLERLLPEDLLGWMPDHRSAYQQWEKEKAHA
jgi:hypothetical protein